MIFDLPTFIQSVGLIGIGAVVFLESGILVGMFLPGDSLLFTAGILASAGYLHFVPLLVVTFVCAVLGNQVGYYTGKKYGPRIFSRPNSRWFNPEHIVKAQAFYEKYGKKTIILCRFIPFVRTVAPIMAGVGLMNSKSFTVYNVVGGALWAVGMTSLGYFLGSTIPNIEKYIIPIVFGIILISVIPVLTKLLHKKT
ncbi:MAG: rane-associated protein [Patescibacteria group bacterium]|nr:rane-associated protein [Patescibacteria group bacterium]